MKVWTNEIGKFWLQVNSQSQGRNDATATWLPRMGMLKKSVCHSVKSLEPKFAIDQSPKMYTAPPQDPYSKVLPTQVKRTRTVFKSLWDWNQTPFGRRLRTESSMFQVVGPTIEKEHRCIVAERANGTTKSRGPRTAACGGQHKEMRGRQSLRIMEGAQL